MYAWIWANIGMTMTWHNNAHFHHRIRCRPICGMSDNHLIILKCAKNTPNSTSRPHSSRGYGALPRILPPWRSYGLSIVFTVCPLCKIFCGHHEWCLKWVYETTWVHGNSAMHHEQVKTQKTWHRDRIHQYSVYNCVPSNSSRWYSKSWNMLR